MQTPSTRATSRSQETKETEASSDLFQKCFEYDLPFLLYLPQLDKRESHDKSVRVAWPEEIMYARATKQWGYVYTDYVERVDMAGFYAPKLEKVDPRDTDVLVTGMHREAPELEYHELPEGGRSECRRAREDEVLTSNVGKSVWQDANGIPYNYEVQNLNIVIKRSGDENKLVCSLMLDADRLNNGVILIARSSLARTSDNVRPIRRKSFHGYIATHEEMHRQLKLSNAQEPKSRTKPSTSPAHYYAPTHSPAISGTYADQQELSKSLASSLTLYDDRPAHKHRRSRRHRRLSNPVARVTPSYSSPAPASYQSPRVDNRVSPQPRQHTLPAQASHYPSPPPAYGRSQMNAQYIAQYPAQSLNHAHRQVHAASSAYSASTITSGSGAALVGVGPDPQYHTSGAYMGTRPYFATQNAPPPVQSGSGIATNLYAGWQDVRRAPTNYHSQPAYYP